MRHLAILYFLFIFSGAIAQVPEIHHVEIGVNGLHCSACSFTVEKALKKVPGVAVVQMDLNERQGKIFFGENERPSFEDLAKAIKDAGYSVRFLRFHLKEKYVVAEGCELMGYCFLELSSDAKVYQIMGESFLPKKEWKQKKMPNASRMCSTCENESYLIRFLP